MHRPTCLAASTLSLWVLRGRRGARAPCIYKVYLVYRELCHLVQYTCPIVLPLISGLNGHYPGLRSYSLPPPPVRSQATPYSQWERRPVRLTSFRLLYLFPPERPEPPEEEEKGTLPLWLFLFLSNWPEGEEVEDCFCAGREAPKELACAEPVDDDPADPPPAAGFRGILGG